MCGGRQVTVRPSDFLVITVGVLTLWWQDSVWRDSGQRFVGLPQTDSWPMLSRKTCAIAMGHVTILFEARRLSNVVQHTLNLYTEVKQFDTNSRRKRVRSTRTQE